MSTYHITAAGEFLTIQTVKDVLNGLGLVCGYTKPIADIYVRGVFHIAGAKPFERELNLRYDWYKVTGIGTKYLEVFIPQDHRSYKVVPHELGYCKPEYKIHMSTIRTVTLVTH